MKATRLFALLLLLPLVALVGCEGDEGPAGPAGTDGVDGVDGVDGNVTCLDCHATETMMAIGYQFDVSQHASGSIAVAYAGGRAGCANCHSGNGYVEWVETGSVDANYATPTAFECKTCHAVHETFEGADFALRKNDPVVWIYDAGYGDSTFDFGDNSNVCAWCHQSRRGEPELTAAGDTTFVITSTHWGPHHGAQSNVWAGVGFAEFAGSTSYPATNIHASAGATCVSCHMAEYADGEGGHTWNPSLASCNDCHGVTETDFDHGGLQGDVEVLLDSLRDVLLANGVIVEDAEDPGHYIPLLNDADVDDVDGDGNTTELFAYVTQDEARAYYNWVGLYEDRSLGAHNPRYVEALLENSIEAISAK